MSESSEGVLIPCDIVFSRESERASLINLFAKFRLDGWLLLEKRFIDSFAIALAFAIRALLGGVPPL